MRRNKDMIIIPFRSCRKSTTAAVLGAATDEHHAALVAGSDEEYAGASPAPHLHCASCAAKIESVVMDIPGVDKVATDVEASRVSVTGTADAAAVATSVQVRTRRPVTVVREGRSGAQERSAAAAATPRERQLVRARGRSTAAQVRPVPERTAAQQQQQAAEEISGRQAQEQDRRAGLLRQMHQQGRPARVATPRGEGDEAHAAGSCNDEVQAQQQQQQQRVRQPEDMMNRQQHLGQA
ncbi:hypothetical protein PVAP13_9NG325400 [Panicum virgatum]|uniref:HMA domain-containing protein n=1 Tax=Panicum virgatum TaxID=38727 RepID=A0A8T0MKR5_PANVG|nr:hypothetical protein PVAP13_9NG325400 [Panicum virgatum]